MSLHSKILGQGQPFLILHGFLGMSDNWKTLGDKFSRQGFEVHLIDQRNHGRSFRSDEFNYEVLVEDLKRYCELNALSDLVLLGHSMGGKTAMLFATTYPELVAKLIVADIAPRFYPRHHDAILNGLSKLNFDSLTSRRQADEILSNYVFEFGVRQFLLKNLYWVEKGKLGLRINLEVLIQNVDEVGEAMPQQFIYHGETLFLKGDKSEYISNEDEMLIIRQFPKAEIETIVDAGHWLHAENPVDFYNAVFRFINK